MKVIYCLLPSVAVVHMRVIYCPWPSDTAIHTKVNYCPWPSVTVIYMNVTLVPGRVTPSDLAIVKKTILEKLLRCHIRILYFPIFNISTRNSIA